MDTGMEKAPARVARRVRHELRFRQLDVTQVEDITPAMRSTSCRMVSAW